MYRVMKLQRCHRLIRLVSALLLAVPAVQAQDAVVAAKSGAGEHATPVVKPKPKSLSETEITSDTMDYDINGRKAVFAGNVRVNDERLQLHADKMTVEFAEGDNLRKIIAEGNVQIKHDESVAKGKIAVYDYESGMIELSGDPTLVQAQTRISGAQSVIYERSKGKFRTQGGKPKLEFFGATTQSGNSLLPGTKGEK